MNPNSKDLSWGNFSPTFLKELTRWIDGRRVLEVFAGNGLLASRLSEQGVDIKATTLFRSHDGHSEGMHYDVEEIEASAAVSKYGKDTDVLLMCWPVPEETALKASLIWGFDRPIIFIGEVTNYDLGHLGGCASDLFFELTAESHTFETYEPRNALERASIRNVDKKAVLDWMKRPPADEPSPFRL